MASLAARARRAARRWIARVVVPRIGDAGWRSNLGVTAAALGLMIFAVRVLGAGWPGHFTIFFPDSFSFKNAARMTPFSPGFYAAERPIAFPTLLFLLGRSTVVTVVVQTLLYGMAYLFAVLAAARLLGQREARFLCGFLLLIVAIEPRFALWNTHILSESFGMTLAVVSVVMWWRFSAAPTVVRLRWAGFATITWLTARDSNVPPWVAVGVPALLVASVLWKSADPKLRRSLRVWGIVTLAVCIGVTLTQSANGRNRYATINNVGRRVLPSAALTDWFVSQGMPIDDALIARTDQDSFSNGWDMLTNPDLAEFRRWADSSGQRTMLVSYVRFAPHYIRALNADLPALLSYQQTDYDAFGVAARLPDAPPAQIGGPTTRQGLFVWTLLALAGVVLSALRRRIVQAVVLGLLLVSTFVDLYMAYVGDSVEVLRHMVGPLSRMALVMVICLCVGVDALIEILRVRIRRHRGAPSVDIADEDAPGIVAEPDVVEADAVLVAGSTC